MDEDVKTTNSMPTYKWVKSKENTPEIYANVVNASWTLVDVRFRDRAVGSCGLQYHF